MADDVVHHLLDAHHHRHEVANANGDRGGGDIGILLVGDGGSSA